MLNRILSKSITKTSYEIWTERKPVLSHLSVWGCPIYVKYLKTDKLGIRSNKYIFIRYLKKIKRYYFYLADEQKVFVSLRIVFLKKKIFEEEINAFKVELKKVQQVELT